MAALKGAAGGMVTRNDSSETAQRRELRVAALTVGGFFVLAAVVGSAVFAFTLLAGGDGSEDEDGPLRAAIVDQLDLTFPNPAFRQEATRTLEAAGYEVDYVPGEQVTVDYYRNLPTHDYDLVVLRIHAARHQNTEGDQPVALAELFTSERFSESRHEYEQEAGQIGAVYYDDPDDELYFGIGPLFVVDSMRGEFDDTTVVMMGCNGLISGQMAEAFIRKGADSFVSWDDLVSVDHTDAATLALLDYMLAGGLSASEASAATMAELGPDPYYGSTLLSYPLDD